MEHRSVVSPRSCGARATPRPETKTHASPQFGLLLVSHRRARAPLLLLALAVLLGQPRQAVGLIGPLRPGMRLRHRPLTTTTPTPPTTVAQASLEPEDLDALFQDAPVPASVAPDIGALARQYLLACCSLNEDLWGSLEPSGKALMQVLARCAEVAPVLVRTDRHLLPLVRLAAWAPAERWARPVAEWDPETTDDAAALTRSLTAHVLEKYEVPSALTWGVVHKDDGAMVTETAQRISRAFVKAHLDAGTGVSVRDTLKEVVQTPKFTKTMCKNFVALDAADLGACKENPLLALRRAQAVSLGGEDWVRDAVCASKSAQRLHSTSDEEFLMAAVQWVCNNADELAEPSAVSVALDFFMEMKRINPDYSVASRTPKSVAEAMEAYELSTVTFEGDEMFEPNPVGIAGFFQTNASIPAGTRVFVPYDGEYELGGPGQVGSEPGTVRISEISSLKRLIFEGEQLRNCLKDKLRSQIKYVSRARQRVSSYWSVTVVRPSGEVDYILLIEIWHLRKGNVVHQAEGPRPRVLPTPEGWYWMEQWCAQENLDLEEWNCYSAPGE